MKLVLYSGGQMRSNHKLHRAVAELARAGKKKNQALSMTYIPFCSEDSNIFYKRIIRRFQSHGIKNFLCLNVDTHPSKSEIKKALQSDVIYLAGGNTFYFLKHLKKSGVLPELKKFVKRGGVLAGLSAGGLIMSPTVALAADQGLGPDENDVNLKNFKALGLFDFEFSPHFSPTRKQIQAHLEYSKKTKYPIYAVEDGGGIIIHGQEFLVLGHASLFFDGTRLALD